MGTDWTMSIVSYLKNGILPEDHNTFHMLRVLLSHFVLIGDVLYKRVFSRPYLRCLALAKADYVMREVH